MIKKVSQPILHKPYDDSLVLYLAVRNHGVGNKLFDLSKHKNHGVMTGCVFTSGSCFGLSRLQFNGVNAAIRVSDNFNFGSKISCFSWIKASPQNGKRIITQHDYGVVQRSFSVALDEVSPYNKLSVAISDDGSWDALHRKYYKSSIIVADNKCHFVGFTFDAGVFKLFIDGVEDRNPTKTYDDAITSLHNSTADIVVGAGLDSNALVDFWTGKLAHMRLYNRVLSVSSVSQLFNKSKHLYGK